MKLGGAITAYLRGNEDEIVIEVETTPRYAKLGRHTHIYEVHVPTPDNDELLALFMLINAKFAVDEDDFIWIDETKLPYKLKEEINEEVVEEI